MISIIRFYKQAASTALKKIIEPTILQTGRTYGAQKNDFDHPVLQTGCAYGA